MAATVIFVDIDSTLVENRFSRRAIGDLLRDIAAATGLSLGDLARELGQENTERQARDPDHPLTMDWDDILQTIAARHGVTLSRPLIDLWNAYAHADEVEVLDNAPDVLRRLRQPHRRLIIATKGLTKYQTPVLRVSGLLALFDAILTPDSTGYLKTTPAYFAASRAAYPDARYIQVGDHYYDDVMCARRNGFTAILRAPIAALQALDPLERPAHLAAHLAAISTYPEAGTPILPDAVVTSLEELPELIARLENGQQPPATPESGGALPLG